MNLLKLHRFVKKHKSVCTVLYVSYISSPLYFKYHFVD